MKKKSSGLLPWNFFLQLPFWCMNHKYLNIPELFYLNTNFKNNRPNLTSVFCPYCNRTLARNFKEMSEHIFDENHLTKLVKSGQFSLSDSRSYLFIITTAKNIDSFVYCLLCKSSLPYTFVILVKTTLLTHSSVFISS